MQSELHTKQLISENPEVFEGRSKKKLFLTLKVCKECDIKPSAYESLTRLRLVESESTIITRYPLILGYQNPFAEKREKLESITSKLKLKKFVMMKILSTTN